MSSWVNGNLKAKISIGQGERGASLEYMWRGTELGIRVEGEEEYQFVNLAPEGVAGKEIELQVGSGYLQWRYKGEESWNNLIAITELQVQGPQGVTPNITVGTVTTLEAGQQATVVKRGTIENPIFDFGIPQGKSGSDGADGATPDMSDFEKKINEQYDNIDTKVKDVDKRVQAIEENGVGGGNANIDDTTISKDTTWSSEKIEDFVHTNDGVVWTTVEGENLSIDYTKEGKLREVEIWGNTWQDTYNSKNLFNKNNVNLLKKTVNEASSYTVEGNTVKFEIPNSGNQFKLRIRLDRSLDVSKSYTISYSSYRAFVNGEWITSGITEGSQSIEEGNIFNVSFIKDWLPITKFEVTNLQIEEGNVATSYIPYHKADLSNIQHLGELYVDDEGQPILDSEGREQYKIEVESVNDNLVTLDNVSNTDKVIISSLNEFTYNSKVTYWAGAKVTFKIPCKPSTKYTIGAIYDAFEYGGKTNRITIRDKDNGVEYACSNNSAKSITSGVDSNYLTITYYPIYGEPTSYPTEDIITKVKLYLQEGSTCKFLDKTINKTTLLLPCQLSKGGDVADRLYWDSEKKKYVVEKNILKEIFNDATGFRYVSEKTNTVRFNTRILITNPKKGGTVICNLLPSQEVYDTDYEGIDFHSNSMGDAHLNINKNKLSEPTVVGLNNYLVDNNMIIYYVTTSPQIIETNITEQISLPCYKDKTHIFVTGGLDGSIKAKVPLDGGQAIQSLSAKNIALNEEVNTLSLENEELKSTNDTQDELINTTMLATDEMYMMLEPLLSEVAQTLSLERSVSKMVDMYVAMVMRGLKTVEQVPARYREEVREILAQLEK